MKFFVAAALVVLALATGCAAPPAPKDLDGLARFFFDHFDGSNDATTSDGELHDAQTKLDAVLKGSAITDPQKGTLANITQDELDAVGLSKKNPDAPQGMFVADVVHCSLAQLKKIVLNPDQLSLYPEAYATYKRDEDSGRPTFNPGWVTTYKSSKNALITNQFTATENSGLRDVPAADGKGEFFVTQVFMPKPAVFDDPDPAVAYTDDYQTEVFYARKPNELVHFYAMWRFMHLGALGDSTSNLFIDETTGGMTDWDTKTDALCK